MSRHRFHKDSVSYFPGLPNGWREERIHDVVDLRTSNVDKKSAEGEIPVRLCNYVDVYKNDRVTIDLDFMEATASEAQIERFGLHVGDVVITKDSETPDDIGVPALIAETSPDLVCGYHLTIMRPNEEWVTGAYLYYAVASRLSAYQFYLAANGVTRFGLTYQGTKSLRIAFPPLPEQQQIAVFLDWKTEQIDTLIARKQELLEKLKEKRIAVITQAVTRGLNPNAPLRDTGIPWLGLVPEHWEVKRLRFLASAIEQGWSPRASNVAAEGNEYGVLKLSAVSRGKFVPHENKMLEEIPEGQCVQSPRKDDLLLTRANTPELVGDVCVVQNDYPQLIIPDLIYRITLSLSLSDVAFVTYFLHSKQGRAQIEANARGSSGSMVKLGQGHLKDFQIPSPSLNEQKAIVNHINRQLVGIESLSVKTDEAIIRLTEYRSALITAATTGKMDARGMKIFAQNRD